MKDEKGGGLLIALMGKGKGNGKKASPPPSSLASPEMEIETGDDDEEADTGSSLAFDAFADAAGIPAANRKTAEAALRQFIHGHMDTGASDAGDMSEE